MTDTVPVEIVAAVATITLNKPERLNALDFEMWGGYWRGRGSNAKPPRRRARSSPRTARPACAPPPGASEPTSAADDPGGFDG